jgi:hypothetical protein
MEQVILEQCIEKVLQHAEHGLIVIQGMTQDDLDRGTSVTIHVGKEHFPLLTHDVGCSGFVRAHLESEGSYTLHYQRIR